MNYERSMNEILFQVICQIPFVSVVTVRQRQQQQRKHYG